MVTPALTQGNPLTDTWIEIFFLKKKKGFMFKTLQCETDPSSCRKIVSIWDFEPLFIVLLFSSQRGFEFQERAHQTLADFKISLELPCDAVYTMKPVMPFMQSLLVRFLAADWTLISHGTAGTGSDLTYETERKTGPRTVNRKYISLNGRWSM
jgi:hypothetical protein